MKSNELFGNACDSLMKAIETKIEKAKQEMKQEIKQEIKQEFLEKFKDWSETNSI